MMKNVAAFFDIDGTLYRDSLMVEHFKRLIQTELIDTYLWHNHAKETYLNWAKRQGNYDDYLLEIAEIYVNALIGLDKPSIEFTSNMVIKLKADRVYMYTRSQIEWHKKQGHTIIFISGSPDYLVSKMAKKYGATDHKGTTYIFKDNLFTGKIVPMWDSQNKDLAMNEFIEKYDIDLSKSYAYGDTNGDVSMFSRVAYPRAINPTKELLSQIKSNPELKEKMEIIIERKDVIYKLDPDSIETL